MFKNRSLCIFGITVLSLTILLGVYYNVAKNDYDREREQYMYMAQNEAEKIITTIDCVMARTATMKALVQDHDGDAGFFEHVAPDIYNSVRRETGVSLKNVALAPEGVVTHVYPYEGNESLIGFNFMDTSKAGNKEALEAYQKGKTILTNPFDLVQGGKGMAGRAPVMTDYANGERLWGLVTVTIDYENLVRVLQLKRYEDLGIAYELSFIDGDGNKNVMESYGTIKATQNPVVKRFEIWNLTWELQIMPERGWGNPNRVIMIMILIMIISVFIGQFAQLLWKLKDSNEMLRHLSNTDKLTRFLNRRAYEDDLLKYPDIPTEEDFVFASMDVNGLKTVNDEMGHQAGDELIIGAAECLKQAFGNYGRLYRTGGDEFVSMFFASPEELEKIKVDAREIIDNWSGKYVDELSISIGYVTKREFPTKTVMELAKIADVRMYEVKEMHYVKRGYDRKSTQKAYNALCDSYTKILETNLTEDMFHIIKADTTELNAEAGYDQSVTLSGWLEGFGHSGLVFEEDVDDFLELTKLSVVREHFKNKESSYSVVYRRKKDDGFEKVMIEFIRAKEYTDESQKVYLFVKSLDGISE